MVGEETQRNNEVSPADDEVSLSDIVAKLWYRRGVIVLLPALAVLAAAVYVFAAASMTLRPVVYHVGLNGIENQQYPNGAAFSPGDLLAPEVLSRLREQFDLPAQGSLRESITVTYDSPLVEGITRSYRERLGARNITQAEMAALNEEFQRELRAAMSNTLRVEVDPRRLGVDEATALRLARAVPATWSEVFTTQFRTLGDTGLGDAAITRSREDLTDTASLLVVNQRLRTMTTGLNRLAGDNRVSLLQTADGFTPEELQQELAGFRITWFNPIMSAGLQTDHGVGAAYLADLRLRMEDLDRRRETYDGSLSQLREFHLLVGPQGERPAPSGAETIQLGDSGLAGVVQLAQQASYADFVRELVRERQQVVFTMSELQRELEMATLSTRIIDGAGFRREAAVVLDELTGRYVELLRLAEQRIRQQIGELYQPVASPMVSGSLVSVQSILLVAAAGGGALLLALIVALAWPTRSGDRQSQSSHRRTAVAAA